MRSRQTALQHGIAGIVMLWAAYFLAKLKQFSFFSGSGSSSERIVYTRVEHPYVFDMIIAGFVLVGLFLLLIAFSSWFPSKEHAGSATAAGGASSLAMKRLWQVVNSLLMISSLYAGWAAMEPDVLRNTNPDVIFCGIVFVIMLLLPLGAVSYSIFAAKQETLRRPSWSRFSVDWWHDPLQCLFLSFCFAASLVIGAAFHLKGATETGFWTFMSFGSIFTGLLIGQIFVYAAYRSRVVET